MQLTTDPDLEVHGDVRWEPGDVAISWVARRWNPAKGQVVDAGIYEAELLFDADGNITGLAQQPLLPLVPAGLVADGNGFLMPDSQGYDWSPDGTTIVSDRVSWTELWLTDVATRQSSRLLQTSFANSPQWSPDGTPGGQKIAFNGPGGIAVIGVDGSNLKLIASGGPNYNYGAPSWSPTGSHLVFYRYDHGFDPGDPHFSVYRSTSDGKQKTNLTNDLVNAIPYGWR